MYASMHCIIFMHNARSISSRPEPDNNNGWRDRDLEKKNGLDPNFIPDPKCGVDIRRESNIEAI